MVSGRNTTPGAGIAVHGDQGAWNAVRERFSDVRRPRHYAGPFLRPVFRPSFSSIASTMKCMMAMSFSAQYSFKRR